MRAAHRIEHLQKETQARVARERVFGDIVVDTNTIDVFENQIGLPAGAHSRVEKACDPGMGEAREHGALTPEARLTGRSYEREIEQLHGGVPLERPIGAARQPHGSHSAAAERALERVGAKLDAAQRHCGRRLQKCARFRRCVTVHERGELGRELGRCGAQLGEPRVAFIRRQLEHAIEHRRQHAPAIDI